MDSVEYTNRRNRIFELVKCGKYQAAAQEADTIDWSIVQNQETIEKVSMIYYKCRHYKDSLRLLEILCQRSPEDVKVIKRICVMAAALGMEEKAWKYYEAYCVQEKSSAAKYILKYRIQRAVGADIKQCILTLHELLKIKYVPKWAYELAECYAKAGMTEESIQECNRVIQETEDEECRQKAEKLRTDLGWSEQEEAKSQQEKAESQERPENQQQEPEGQEQLESQQEKLESQGQPSEEEPPAEMPAVEDADEEPADDIDMDIEQKLAGLSQSCEQVRKQEQSRGISQQEIESLLRQIE